MAELAGVVRAPGEDEQALFVDVDESDRVCGAARDRCDLAADEAADRPRRRDGAAHIIAEAALAVRVPSPAEEAAVVRDRHGVAATARYVDEAIVRDRLHQSRHALRGVWHSRWRLQVDGCRIRASPPEAHGEGREKKREKKEETAKRWKARLFAARGSRLAEEQREPAQRVACGFFRLVC